MTVPDGAFQDALTSIMTSREPISCAHCGRMTRNYRGGYALAVDSEGNPVAVCHPNEADRPDCLALIEQGHPVRDCPLCTPIGGAALPHQDH